MSASKGAFAPALSRALAGQRPFAVGGGGRSWYEATRAKPCPVCGHGSWCQLARDGATVLCHRVASDRERVARDGTVFHVHHLDAAERAPRPRYLAPLRPTAAPPSTLARAYEAALSRLVLAPRHRVQLHARGFDDKSIALRGYATLDVRGRASLARVIVEAVGEEAALAVPGIVRKEGERGEYLSLGGPAGLVVPVRDREGRVVALCVRRDEAGDAGKYAMVSSSGRGGASPGAPLHWPLHEGDRSELVLTEGVLKGDVATHLAGRLVLGLPGVGAWRLALEAVAALDPARVLVAFDADAAVNPHVARAEAELVAALRPLCPRVEAMRWDPRFKGLDDALLHRAQRRAAEENDHG